MINIIIFIKCKFKSLSESYIIIITNDELHENFQFKILKE